MVLKRKIYHLKITDMKRTFLDELTPEMIQDNPFPVKEVLENSIYYPASGFDGGLIRDCNVNRRNWGVNEAKRVSSAGGTALERGGTRAQRLASATPAEHRYEEVSVHCLQFRQQETFRDVAGV